MLEKPSAQLEFLSPPGFSDPRARFPSSHVACRATTASLDSVPRCPASGGVRCLRELGHPVPLTPSVSPVARPSPSAACVYCTGRSRWGPGHLSQPSQSHLLPALRHACLACREGRGPPGRIFWPGSPATLPLPSLLHVVPSGTISASRSPQPVSFLAHHNVRAPWYMEVAGPPSPVGLWSRSPCPSAPQLSLAPFPVAPVQVVLHSPSAWRWWRNGSSLCHVSGH
jgi:hypothetical protein